MAEKKAKDKDKPKIVFGDGRVTLGYPYQYEGETIKSVPWPTGRVKARVVLASEKEMAARGVANPGEGTRTFYMVSQMTGLEPESLQEMDLGDYLALAARSTDFL